MKKSVALMLCVVLALLLVPVASANVPQFDVNEADYRVNDYIVTASALHYRDSASADGEILGSFYQGTIIPVTGFSANGRWASAIVGEKTVWIYTEYIESAIDFAIYRNANTYTVKAYPYAVVVNFLADGSVETVGKIAKGDSVVVYKINDTWGLVNDQGISSYIQMGDLK